MFNMQHFKTEKWYKLILKTKKNNKNVILVHFCWHFETICVFPQENGLSCSN